MKSNYDVVIIGAGIGGLVSGCYLAKAGMSVMIVEQSNKPGGSCTSFNKNGFIFDVGVHYLGSCREGKGILFTILNDLSLNDDIKFLNCDPYDRIITPNEDIYISKDLARTVAEFTKWFPKQSSNIKSFFNFVLSKDLVSLYGKTKNLSFRDFLESFFDDQRLISILSIPLGNIGLPPSKASAFIAIMLYKEYVLDGGYYPQGGIQKFSDLLSAKFESFGGQIFFNRKVESVIERNNIIHGVKLEYSGMINTKFVVANCDAHYLFNKLLLNETKEKKRVETMIMSASAFVVYLGIRDNIKKLFNKHLCSWFFSSYDIEKCYDTNYRYCLEKQLTISEDVDYLVCQLPSLVDDEIAPRGKSAVRAMIWVSQNRIESWIEASQNVYTKVLNKMALLIPNIQESIEVKEIITPYDIAKNTNNNNGAIFGWAATTNQVDRNIFQQVTSIAGLYIVGSWTTNGFGQCGVPVVALSGKNVAKKIRAEYVSGNLYE